MNAYKVFGKRWNNAQRLKQKMIAAEKAGNMAKAKGLASRVDLNKRLAKEIANANS